MGNAYTEWTTAYLARNNGRVRGWCSAAAKEMREAFPELTEVRGFANGYEHVWLTAPDGTVVDPTASQFEAPIAYAPWKPGDEIRVGRCMNCGWDIYEGLQSLADKPKRTMSCSDACDRVLQAEFDE